MVLAMFILGSAVIISKAAKSSSLVKTKCKLRFSYLYP